jgi:hypothetical protein
MTPASPILAAVLAILLAAQPAEARSDRVQSVGAMTFADADTLVVSDWRAGELHALTLPPAHGTGKPFNLSDVSSSIAKVLHTQPDKLRFEDLAFRPDAEMAYISLSVLRVASSPAPAIVAVDASGNVSAIDFAKTKHASVPIASVPAPDKMLWRDVPEATLTVTNMTVYDKKLYVAGLSNASFASTLRVYDLPLGEAGTATSIEMYHPVHNQLETRAPIREMTIVSLDGEPTLVAAFTCTPLVTIPLKDLKDGAHVVAKTVGELGWGSAPVGMVSYDTEQGPVIVLANSRKAADLLSVADIAKASAQPGLKTPIKWPTDPLLGVKAIYLPIASVARIGIQDKDFLAALRRNEESGAMELVSMRKGTFLRLSDFVNEYDFADFRYPPDDGWHGVHHQLRIDEGYSDLAVRAQQ